MIRVTALYPRRSDGTFDHEYCRARHLPLVASLMGDALKAWELYRPIAGPGEPPPEFVAVVHLYFDDVATFYREFGRHSPVTMEDAQRYTDIHPILLVEEKLQSS